MRGLSPVERGSSPVERGSSPGTACHSIDMGHGCAISRALGEGGGGIHFKQSVLFRLQCTAPVSAVQLMGRSQSRRLI